MIFFSFLNSKRDPGHCGGLCDGEEDAEQAHEGDSHQAGGVRVHQDHHLPRVGHSQGEAPAWVLTNLKHEVLLIASQFFYLNWESMSGMPSTDISQFSTN